MEGIRRSIVDPISVVVKMIENFILFEFANCFPRDDHQESVLDELSLNERIANFLTITRITRSGNTKNERTAEPNVICIHITSS